AMKKSETLAEITNIVNQLAAKHQRPLIVAKGEFLPAFYEAHQRAAPSPDRVLGIAHPNARTIWFGNQTRSSNDYQDCDALIVVGHYQERITSTEILAATFSLVSVHGKDSIRAPKQFEIIGDSP